MLLDSEALEILDEEQAYESEGYYIESILNFAHRYQSMQRYWLLSKIYIEKYTEKIKDSKRMAIGEDEIFLDDTGIFDIEYFQDYSRASTISFSISLVENFLEDISQEVSKIENKVIKLSEKNMPYINKYILWLTEGCGININLNSEINSNLNAIREIRNRFVHKIDRDIPENIRKTLTKMINNKDNNVIIDDLFIEKSIIEIAKLVKSIELAYIKYLIGKGIIAI